METYFHGIWRMDWGLGNPNKTAALIATLMVTVWWLVYIRRFGFWAALTLFTGLGVCLIRTFSRGGLVALAVGLIPLLWKSSRPWAKSRITAVAVSIWIMVGSSILWEAHERLGQGVAQEDRSITNRLEIWMKAPRMMVDAPHGWGLGNSGKAFMQWYQSVDRGEDYRTLVNSHLTWMVEFGWPFRLLYMGGWLVALILVWPTKKRPWFALPLGIWLCFGTAAWFSSVAESKWIWIVPGLSGLAVLLHRLKDRTWPRLRIWIASGAIALVVTLALFIAGSLLKEFPVQGSGQRVILGGGKPEIWILVDEKTMGSLYGKTIRSAILASPSKKTTVGVIQNIKDLPSAQNGTLVVGGSLPPADLTTLKSSLSNWRKLVLINPAFLPEELGLTETLADKIEVIFGEFSQSPALSAWALFSPRRIEGGGDFLADWASLVLGSRT